MADKAWKRREREVASYFNGVRTSLSGINSKVTRADVIHDELFVECKLRAKHSVVSLWDDTSKLANLLRALVHTCSVLVETVKGPKGEPAAVSFGNLRK